MLDFLYVFVYNVCMKKFTLGEKLCALYLVVCFLGGAYTLRSAYKNSWEFPNEDKLGVFTVGIGEILSPVWFPVILIGNIVLFNIEK